MLNNRFKVEGQLAITNREDQTLEKDTISQLDYRHMNSCDDKTLKEMSFKDYFWKFKLDLQFHSSARMGVFKSFIIILLMHENDPSNQP